MNNYYQLINQMRSQLPLNESFDVMERKMSIGGREASLFYVEGLVDGDIMQLVISYLLKVTAEDNIKATDAETFLENNIPFLSANTEADMDAVLRQIYSGLLALVVDGYEKTFIVDVRSYPTRGVEEPSKEKSLRGAKDGFTETLMSNVALIRRRLRDNNLIFKTFVVGNISKSDVCLVYLKGKADQSIADKLSKSLGQLKLETTTVGEQTIVEALNKQDDKRKRKRQSWINPFPKVRYTQRPDLVSAHISEGKIAILVDNSPTAILLPAGIFDFTQDVDDYYFPVVTGNYFRLLRIANFLLIIFMTPVYILVVEGHIPIPINIDFFAPESNFAIPIFWQFIILELAIDGLKLASLNTPDSLGMSLSVIGALILGDFSVSSGWFIPQTILCMAVVALASFTQPSIELGYGIKFTRMLILIGVFVFGIWGGVIGFALSLLMLATTKTLVGTSYLYPLIPFNKDAAKKLFFRTKL